MPIVELIKSYEWRHNKGCHVALSVLDLVNKSEWGHFLRRILWRQGFIDNLTDKEQAVKYRVKWEGYQCRRTDCPLTIDAHSSSSYSYFEWHEIGIGWCPNEGIAINDFKNPKKLTSKVTRSLSSFALSEGDSIWSWNTWMEGKKCNQKDDSNRHSRFHKLSRFCVHLGNWCIPCHGIDRAVDGYWEDQSTWKIEWTS